MGVGELLPEPRQTAGAGLLCGGLRECLRQLHGGPWRFLQLRGAAVDSRSVDHDDIDLLGTRESVDLLIAAAWAWMRAGKCHLHVVSRRPEKVELTLFSRDGRQHVQFDLWIVLAQFDGGRRQLVYADCEPWITDRQAGIGRLPVQMECCIYVQHLVAKRKAIGSDSCQQRLQDYRDRCAQAGFTELAGLLERIRKERRIGRQDAQQTLQRLDGTAGPRLQAVPRNRLSGFVSKLRLSWLTEPRMTRLISLIGCDGAGKTTLAERIVAANPEAFRVVTGKRLYRGALLYKLAVIFLRPLITRSRERFDDILAPVLYLRAALSLRIRVLTTGRRVSLIDRSLVDFLYVDRKTDTPAFRWRWLTRLAGCRIPTIHCTASHETVMSRKQEITRAGHAAYDRDMFHELSRRVPTNYLAFNNDQPLFEAVSAMQCILMRLLPEREMSRTPDSSGREAAAVHRIGTSTDGDQPDRAAA